MPDHTLPSPIRAAYADPPYLGLAEKFYGHLHPDAAAYDRPETHRALIERLNDEYDCWAMSLHSPALHTILPMCPPDVRVMAWTKTWCSFKPGRKDAHMAWEPVIVRGGRPQAKRLHAVRDYCSTGISNNGFKGSKPDALIFWIFEVLNLEPTDEFHDLFPGSGAVTRAWEQWRDRIGVEQFSLLATDP